MTNEEIVKRKWPDALCWLLWKGCYEIWTDFKTTGGGYFIGTGKTKAEAWADAASRIEAQKEQG